MRKTTKAIFPSKRPPRPPHPIPPIALPPFEGDLVSGSNLWNWMAIGYDRSRMKVYPALWD